MFSSAFENETVAAELNDSLLMESATSFAVGLNDCLLMAMATFCIASCGLPGEIAR